MIEKYQFGSIKIDGQEFQEDIFIDLESKVNSWRRKRSHTFEKGDVEKFLKKQPKMAVFGTGEYGAAQLAEDLRDFFQEKGIELIAKPTNQAIKDYNQAKEQGREVVAFFHLTC